MVDDKSYWGHTPCSGEGGAGHEGKIELLAEGDHLRGKIEFPAASDMMMIPTPMSVDTTYHIV